MRAIVIRLGEAVRFMGGFHGYVGVRYRVEIRHLGCGPWMISNKAGN